MSDSVGKISLDLEVNSDLQKQIRAASDNMKKQLEKAVSSDAITAQLRTIIDNFSRMLSQVLKKNMDAMSKQIELALKKMTQVNISPIKMPDPVTVPQTKIPVQTTPRAPPISDVKVPGIKLPKLKLDFNADIVKSQMESVEKEMDNLEAKISLQNQALKKLKAQYNNTFNDVKKTSIQTEMLKTEKSIIGMGTKMDVLGARYTALEAKALSYAKTASNVFAKSGLSVKIPPINTAPQISQVKGLGDAVGMFGAEIAETSTPLQNMRTLLKRTFSVSGIKNLLASIRQLPGAIGGVSESFTLATPKVHAFSRATKSAKTSNNGFNQGIGNTIKQMFKWMIILPGIVKGLTTMTTSLFQSLQTNDQFNDSLAQIKSNLMVAFTPIFQAILPAINALMSALAKATAYVASFISQLFGKSFSKSFGATQQLISAKDAMGAYGTTSKKTTNATKAATKANEQLKRSLMGFDQINKLDDASSQADDTTEDGGEVSEAPVLVKPMVDPSLLDAATIPWVNKFKDVLSKILQPFQQAWSAEGANTINAMKSALDSVWTLIKDIGKSFLSVWTNGTGTIILTNILLIFQNIFKIIKNIASGLSEAWNENGNGTAIIQSVLDIFNIVLDTINRIAGATVEWAEKLNFSPLLESVRTLLESLEPLAQNIGDGLAWFWENVLLPIAGWAIETAVPTFLDMLSAAIGALNEVIEALKPLGLWLFDNLLKPLGEWAGEIFIGAMQTVTDLLKKFGDWCTNNQTTVQNIAIVIGSLATAFGIVTLATTLWGVACGIAGAAVAFLTSPVTIAAAIIGGLIAVGILLWKNWDTIKAKALEIWGALKDWFKNTIDSICNFFKNLWSGIKDTFASVGDWFSGKFSAAWTGIKNSFSHAGQFFKDIWQSICNTFGNVTGWFKDKFSAAWQAVKDVFSAGGEVFNGIKDGILSGLKAVINGLIDGINSVISIPFSGISWALDQLRNVSIAGFTPFTWLPSINTPQIPHLAQGGYVKPNTPQLAMIGDNRHQGEVVAPEDKLIEMARQAAAMAGGGGSAELVSLLKEILKILKDRKIVEIDEESLRKWFINKTNKNTIARGKSELLTV